MRSIIILLALSMLQSAFAAGNNMNASNGAVEYKPQYEQTETSEPTEELPSDIKRLRINNEFWYIVLLSALCVISLTIVLSFLKHKEHSAKDIVNAAGLTLIIFGTIILVLVVSTSEQLTAAIGILGAIAGYLFRSVQGNEEK